ncbi:MAG: family 20 glycosylhydrolase, partial [Clostridia bacterium]|nr:family 20 glycosylhydrolase [Clostridia bacterium]
KSTDISEFIRAFSLDCGRIYFSVDQIEAIIDLLAENNYTHLALAFGNSGFRFLLDDMSVDSYSSDDVKNAILAGNTYYVANDGHNGSSAANTCLTEADMDTIISYADSKGISIVPVLNSPGHMNTIVYAMGELGISNAGYPVTSSYNSESTININDSTVTDFVSKLIQKYITYFDNKGCTMFNMGADEFANDPTDDSQLGFNTSMKNAFISYVNSVATMVSDAGMTPMMFNDGYAWSDANFNKDIVICYWTTGAVSAAAIANAGHKVINTNQNWYYVLGEPFGTASNSWCSYAKALNGVTTVPVTSMVDGSSVTPIGSMMCFWCDYTDQVYTTLDTETAARVTTMTEYEKVSTLISTLSANNPTYFSAASEDTEESEPEAEIRNITVAVNNNETNTISGSVYTEYEIADSSKVTVVLNPTDAVNTTTVSTTKATELEDGATYIIRVFDTIYALSSNSGSGAWGTQTLAFEANYLTADTDNLWTLEASGSGYKLKNAAGYLNLGSENNTAYLNSTGEVFTITNTSTGWTIVNPSGKYINALGGLTSYYSAGGWSGDGTRFDLYKVTTESVASTEVTFTGVAVGTTIVTVGHVTYNVTVTEEDISDVSLTYHPWISTYNVYPEGSNGGDDPGVARNVSIAATATDVYSEQGAAISSLVDATGDWQWEEDAQTVYWKATILAEGSHQDATTDRSMSGTDFTYIRYWGGVWSYSSDQVTWTEIKDTDEVCAYYLQKTEVTTEVTTYVKDWAFTNDNADGKDENRYQKALSLAVVYPGGTMNPTEENIYGQSTLIYWDNLADLGFIRVGVNELYQVEKITYTFGERASTSNGVNWTADETIDWEKVTITDDSGTSTTWYDETVCWDESYGTEPVVNGADLADEIYAGRATSGTTYYDGTWGANDAVLILIYLKPVETEDSLTVIYYDEKFGDVLHTYYINVESGHNFNDNIIKLTSGNTEDPGYFVDSDGNTTTRINVDGYGILNSNEPPVTQIFQVDLTQVPDAIGKYNSKLYEYTGSVISEDGKTLYLYYNIDTDVLSPNFVVDFGLPITFSLNQVTNTPDLVEEITASARYGTVVYNATTKTFNYTPNTILLGIDIISINIRFDGVSSTTITNVGVTPATTVYYEEGFLNYDSNWTAVGSALNPYQATVEIGMAGTKNYGYDAVYADDGAVSSNGTYIESNNGGLASFTFTGTGFELYANSNGSSGYVTVYSKGELSKLYMINTVLSGSTTESDVTNNQQDAANANATYYSLPIISETTLPYGTYTVQIKQTNGEAPIYIDGVRIINTIDESSLTDNTKSIYYVDLEDNPDFYELRDCVLNGINVESLTQSEYIKDTNNDRDSRVAAVKDMAGQVYNSLADEDGNVTAEALYLNSDKNALTTEQLQDLLDNGPKNELYMYPGQTLAFSVTTDRVMQLGLKSPTGSAEFTLTVNDTTLDLNSLSTTVDMFYKIADKGGTKHNVSITVTEGLLSVTKLKICDDPNFTFNALTETDITNVLLNLYGFEDEIITDEETPEEPAVTYADAYLNIGITDISGGDLGTVTLTANGAEGTNHTFTSDEILEAIKAGLNKNYIPVGDSAISNMEVKYGETGEIEVQEYLDIIPVYGFEIDFDKWQDHWAEKERWNYTITAKAGEGGSISSEGDKGVKFNETSTYTFIPDEGYEVCSVVIDGKDMGAISRYTFRNIREDHTISVEFCEEGTHEHSKHSENERPDNNDRDDRNDQNNKNDWNNRNDRNDKNDRNDRNNSSKNNNKTQSAGWFNGLIRNRGKR